MTCGDLLSIDCSWNQGNPFLILKAEKKMKNQKKGALFFKTPFLKLTGMAVQFYFNLVFQILVIIL